MRRQIQADKVSEEVPCLRQLVYWNSSPGEGRGETHQHIEHRLRQIGRGDLADWLGKTTFRQLGKDLLKSIDEPFGDIVPTEEPQQQPNDEQTTLR